MKFIQSYLKFSLYFEACFKNLLNSKHHEITFIMEKIQNKSISLGNVKKFLYNNTFLVPNDFLACSFLLKNVKFYVSFLGLKEIALSRIFKTKYDLKKSVN